MRDTVEEKSLCCRRRNAPPLPPIHRSSRRSFPFGLYAMAQGNSPPNAYYLAAIVLAGFIGLLSRDLYHGKHRTTNHR
jgi:hypothetical protein